MTFDDLNKKLKIFPVVFLLFFVFAAGWLLPGANFAAQADDYQKDYEYKYEYKPSQDYPQQGQSGVQSNIEKFQNQVQDKAQDVTNQVQKKAAQSEKALDQASEQIKATAKNVQEKLGQTPTLETATTSIQAAVQSAIDRVKSLFASN